MRFLFTSYIIFTSVSLIAQLGGIGTYEFLNLSQSARISALGGYGSMLRDDDVNIGLANPASLNANTSDALAFNHNFHIADISHGYITYGFNLDSSQLSLAIGAQYVSYGKFMRVDFRDQMSGSFNAAEYACSISAAKLIASRLSIGATLKLVRSDLDQYNSFGLVWDFGIQYLKPANRSAWSFVIKNIGVQLTQFSNMQESVPINIQIGYAKKMEHIPFKFLVTLRDLQRWDIRQSASVSDDPIFINQSNSATSNFSKFTDNLFRHMVIGGEFILGQRDMIRLRFAYNHQRNQELKSSVFRSFGGFSFGIGVKIKRFRFDYGIGNYHLSGGVNHLSLLVDLSDDGPIF